MVIFALEQHELVVAQTAIVGSLLANALLVLGLVIVVGAARAPNGVMRFSARLPRDTSTLLLVTVSIIVLLGLSLSAHDPASHHVKGLSAIGASCLLLVYLTWLVPYLRSDVPPEEQRSPGGPRLPLPLGLRAAARRGHRLRIRLVVVRECPRAGHRGAPHLDRPSPAS